MHKRISTAVRTRLSLVGLAGLALLGCASPGTPSELAHAHRAVDAVLEDFHLAASEADGARYFDHLSADAIYLGTDATERWTRDEFRAFAEPYFARGTGWTYIMTERHISFGPGGRTAWFDERLENEAYGDCRGSGALVLEDGRWRISQYNLTFPIPNELAREFIAKIREHAAR